MGNFEKLSVLVIVVIIVMILVVAIYTWTDNPDNSAVTGNDTAIVVNPDDKEKGPLGAGFPSTKPAVDPWVFPKDVDLVEPLVDPIVKPFVEPIEKPVGNEPKKADGPKASGSDTPGEPWMYTIKGGDCLTLIAQNELGTMGRVDDIVVLNPGLSRDSVLRVGKLLKMPARGAVSPNPPRSGTGGATRLASTGGPKAGEIYLTRSGDTLEKVSKDAFGSTDYWPEIWAKNLDVLDAPKDMRAGLKLMIPKVKKFK
jgi:hypothetical protein